MGMLEQGANAATTQPAAVPPQPVAAAPVSPAATPQPAATSASPAQGGAGASEEEATPEEQQEYERAMTALSKVLYDNEEVSNSVVDQVDPNDLVGSTAKVSMLFMKQLDEKVDLDESVIAQMTEETVSRIIELAEARHGVEYQERDMQAILGATWEGVSEMFGASAEEDPEGMKEFINSVGSENIPALQQQYEAALNG